MMATGSYAGQASATATDRAVTLNERANKTAEGLQYQCERLENVLNRVHGNPTPIKTGERAGTQVNPTLPLANVVEHLEAILSRLNEIALSAERIA